MLLKILKHQKNTRNNIPHIDISGLCYAALRIHELLPSDAWPYEFSKTIANSYCDRHGAQDGIIPYAVNGTEVLVDTIAFLCPFLARLSRMTGESIYKELSVRQIKAFMEHGIDTTNGWAYHGFNINTKQSIGRSGWGRGVGWLLLGMTDTYIELDAHYPDVTWLKSKIEQLVDKLSQSQCDNGHWSTDFSNTESETDSSLTAIVAYSLARLSTKAPALAEKCNNMLTRALAALDAATDTDGWILHASGEAQGICRYSNSYGKHIWALAPALAARRILFEHQ